MAFFLAVILPLAVYIYWAAEFTYDPRDNGFPIARKVMQWLTM